MCSVIRSFPTLCDWWTRAHLALPPIRFSRQEYWNRLSFPPLGDLPDPGIKPVSPASLVLSHEFFITEPSGKLIYVCVCVCVCVFIYIYRILYVYEILYIYIKHTHTYTHTYFFLHIHICMVGLYGSTWILRKAAFGKLGVMNKADINLICNVFNFVSQKCIHC